MKNLCLLFIIILPLHTQAEAGKCDQYFLEGDRLAKKDSISLAIAEYFKVLSCDRKKSSEVEKKIKELADSLSQAKHQMAMKLKRQKDIFSALFGNAKDSLIWTLGPNGKYGVFNQNQTINTKGFKWDNPQPFKQGVARAQKGGEWFFVDANGEPTTESGYDFIHPSSQDYFLGIQMTQDFPLEVILDARGTPKGRVRMLKKGFVKADDTVFPFGDENKWGLMDKQGRLRSETNYDYVGKVYEGYSRVRRGAQWGYIDSYGKTPKWGNINYDEASDFAGGIAWVREDRNYYLIVLAENKKMPAPASSLIELYERYFAAVNDAKGGKISAEQFEGKTPPIQEEAPKLFFDEKGLRIIAKEGDTKNIALFRRNDKYQLFDREGAPLSDQYDMIYQQSLNDSSDKLVYITQRRAHYGLLVYQVAKASLPREIESLTLANDYEELGEYQVDQNCIRIKQNGKWGFIVWQNGKRTEIPCNYDLVSNFFYHPKLKQDVARVYVEAYDLYFFIDKDGRLLNTIERDKIW